MSYAAIEVVACNGRIVRVPLHQLAKAFTKLEARPAADRIDRIQAACCSYFGISRKALRGASRRAHIVLARHVAIYLVREATSHSLPEIARRFGRVDHTTALHAVRKIAELIDTDERLVADIRTLRRALAAGEKTS